MFKATISTKVIETALKEKWETSLPYYFKLFQFKHILHETKVSQLAKMIGVSHNCLKFHLNVLSEKKMIRYDGETVRKVSMYRFGGAGYKITKIWFADLKQSTIKEAIRLLILKMNINSQAFIIQRKKDIKKWRFKVENGTCTVRDYKNYKKTQDVDVDNGFLSKTVLSGDRYSDLLNRHRSTAYRMMRKLASKGFISIEKRFGEHECKNYKHYKELKAYEQIPQYATWDQKKKKAIFSLASIININTNKSISSTTLL